MKIDPSVLRAVNNYNNAVKSLAATSEKLSSGSRIFRAANDSSSMVINAKLRAQLNGLQQAARNAQEGIGVVNVADGALGSIFDHLTRVRELAVGAANTGFHDADSRAAFDVEAQQLVDSANHIAEKTAYAATKLLDGSYSGQSFMIGDSGANVLSLSIADSRATALGIASLDLAGNASSAITAIDAAISTISSRRADLGAVASRFSSTVQLLNNAVENLSSASSRLADADIVKTAAQFQRDKVMLQNSSRAIDRAMANTVQVLRVVK
jgi:flagellin